MQIGIACLKILDFPGQQMDLIAFRQTEIEVAPCDIVHSGEFIQNLICHINQILRPLSEQLTFVGQFNAEGMADKEIFLKLRFQSLHLLGKGRLCHVQGLGSPYHIFFSGYSQEIS